MMDGLEGDDYYDIAELESSDEERADIAGSDSDADADADADAAAAADDGQSAQELYSEGGIERRRKSHRKEKEKQEAGGGSSSRGKATQRRQSATKKGKEKVSDDVDPDAQDDDGVSEYYDEEVEGEEEEEEEEEDSDDSQERLDDGDEDYVVDEEDDIDDDELAVAGEEYEEEGTQTTQTDGQTMYAKLVASKRARSGSGKGNSSTQKLSSQGKSIKNVYENSPGFDDIMSFTKSLRSRRRRPKHGLRGRKPGVRRTGNFLLGEKCGKMISDAMLLSTTDSDKAIALLLEVVRIAPQFPDTYGSLGMVHQSIDDHYKAIQYYMMEAELSSEDVNKWRDIVQMALQYNQKQQAIYCLKNIVKLDPEDTEALFLIVDLSIQLEDYWRAIETLHVLEEKNLEKHDIVQRLVPCYHAVGDSAKAIESIQQYLQEKWDQKEEVDLTLVNILCELFFEGDKFQEAGDLIVQVAAEDSDSMLHSVQWSVYNVLDRDNSIHGMLSDAILMLPLDLVVKFGIIACRLDYIEESFDFFKPLLSERVEDYVDLYHTVGSLMLKLGKAKYAVQFLEGVLQVWNIEENVSIAHQLAEAQTLAGSHDEAEALYKEILKSFPQDTAAQFGLSALLSAREQNSTVDNTSSQHQGQGDVEMTEAGDSLEDPDFGALTPLNKLAHLKLLLSLSQFPRAAMAARALLLDLLGFISSGSYLHYLQDVQTTSRASQTTLIEHLKGRDQEGLFSGEESEEYKKLLNQIKNRRHYKSLIESGNNPAEALSIAIEAVKEQEKEKAKSAEARLRVESAGYLDILDLGRGLEEILALTVDLECACELENKSLRLISKIATTCAEEKVKARSIIQRLQDRLPPPSEEQGSGEGKVRKKRKKSFSGVAEDTTHLQSVLHKLTVYSGVLEQVINRLPSLELGIGIIMVSNEKASAPSIESLRAACESSDKAPMGLWNWIAALKAQRRSSVLKNYLTKTIAEHPNNYAARLLRANQYRLSGRLAIALTDYLKVLYQSRDDRRTQSLASLYAGITCLNIAVSKREIARFAALESSAPAEKNDGDRYDRADHNEDLLDKTPREPPGSAPSDSRKKSNVESTETRPQREHAADFCRSGLALLLQHANFSKSLAHSTGNSMIFADSIYNVARGMQGIGNFFLAEQLYKECLDIVVPIAARSTTDGNTTAPAGARRRSADDQTEEPTLCEEWNWRQCIGLQRQAAYNLSCIYTKSGNLDKARQVIKQYCTI